MSNPFIWGSAPRATNDPTLVDEAIAEAIASHKDDPDAHLGPDGSLESHRAAEIIDHRAESVVNDKIKATARTYVAIVDPGADGDFDTVEDAVDYATEKGGGSVFIRAGNYAINRPLNLRYGVDLYGEGPRETHLTFYYERGAALNLAGIEEVRQTVFPMINYWSMDYFLEYFIDNMQGTDELEYTQVRLDYGTIQCYGKIWDGGVEVGELAPDDGTAYDVEIVPTVNASTASNIVHVNGWKLLEGLEDLPGSSIYTDAGRLGQVHAYLGNGDLQLNQPSAIDAYLSTNIWGEGDTGRLSVISSLSINTNQTSTAISVDGRKGRLYIRDSNLEGFNTLFRDLPDLQDSRANGVTMQDCILKPMGNANLRTDKGYFENTVFDFSLTSSPEILGGVASVFENCTFIGRQNLMAVPLRLVWIGSRFVNCYFDRGVGGVLINNNSGNDADPWRFIMFSNCVFLQSPRAASVLFKGRNLIITGCRFYCGTTTGLDSTSRRCVFTGNHVTGTLAATPTECLVANNGVWT